MIGFPTGAKPTASVSAQIPVDENAGSVDVEVTLSSAALIDFNVQYQITFSGNPAASAADLGNGVALTGSIPFSSGATAAILTIPIVDDAAVEGPESFTVTLTGVAPATGATLSPGQSSAVVTIYDNDVANNQQAVYISNLTRPEGNNGGGTAFIFTVTRLNPVSDITVQVTTEEAVAAANPATPGNDYAVTVSPAVVTFTGSETSKQVTVTVVGDTDYEPDETFHVRIAVSNGNATVTNAVAQGVIVNDDPKPPGFGTIFVDGFEP